MATNRRATRRPKGRSSGTKRRSPAARKKGALGVVSTIKQAFSRQVVGVFLLVTGLFFTAAFLTGQGAFLGEAGLAAATYLAGVIGLMLPPLLPFHRSGASTRLPIKREAASSGVACTK